MALPMMDVLEEGGGARLYPIVGAELSFLPAGDGDRTLLNLLLDVGGLQITQSTAFTEQQAREIGEALVLSAAMMRDGRAAAIMSGGTGGTC